MIRNYASESERLGHLRAADRRCALHEANLFRLLVPTELGGLGLTIPDAGRVFERVSALDASTGWTLTILNSGAIFARFLPAETFATVCRDPRGLIAGSLNPVTARAEPVNGGYLFSGRATIFLGFRTCELDPGRGARDEGSTRRFSPTEASRSAAG